MMSWSVTVWARHANMSDGVKTTNTICIAPNSHKKYNHPFLLANVIALTELYKYLTLFTAFLVSTGRMLQYPVAKKAPSEPIMRICRTGMEATSKSVQNPILVVLH